MSSQRGPQQVGKSKLTYCVIAVAFALLGVSSVYADIVDVGASDLYHGSRNSGEGGGIFATGPWADGFVLSWHITENPSGTFTYEYGFSGLGDGVDAHDVNNWILQLTPDIDWTGVFDGVAGLVEPPEVGLFTQGPSTPDLPGDLFGVKFEFVDGTLVIQFVTEYGPEWGSFWANGGRSRRQNVYAYNTGFGTDPVGTDYTNWIPVDGVHSVPEPSTLILLLSGAGLLAGAARFRKKT